MPEQLKKAESLVRAAPDPESDRAALLELRDSGSLLAQGLAESLLADEVWRTVPLRELLPGLSLSDVPNFSIRLSVRTAIRSCVRVRGRCGLWRHWLPQRSSPYRG